MERWMLILIIFAMAAIIIYAFNSYSQVVRSQQAREQRDYINQTITEKFQESFERQNFLGNTTTDHIIAQNDYLTKLLENRTARFDEIDKKQDAIIANERVLINNQYKFSLPDELNVSGISNITR